VGKAPFGKTNQQQQCGKRQETIWKKELGKRKPEEAIGQEKGQRTRGERGGLGGF